MYGACVISVGIYAVRNMKIALYGIVFLCIIIIIAIDVPHKIRSCIHTIVSSKSPASNTGQTLIMHPHCATYVAAGMRS